MTDVSGQCSNLFCDLPEYYLAQKSKPSHSPSHDPHKATRVGEAKNPGPGNKQKKDKGQSGKVGCVATTQTTMRNTDYVVPGGHMTLRARQSTEFGQDCTLEVQMDGATAPEVEGVIRHVQEALIVEHRNDQHKWRNQADARTTMSVKSDPSGSPLASSQVDSTILQQQQVLIEKQQVEIEKLRTTLLELQQRLDQTDVQQQTLSKDLYEFVSAKKDPHLGQTSEFVFAFLGLNHKRFGDDMVKITG